MPKQTARAQSPARPPESTEDSRVAEMDAFLHRPELAANSRRVYQRELQRFLVWTPKAWSDLTPADLALYRDYLTDEVETARGKPLAKSSINSAIAALRSLFNWLVDQGRLNSNPAALVAFEKLPAPMAQTLSNPQLQHIWQALDFLEETYGRDVVLIHLLIHGLKAGEIVGLNIGQFDGRLLRIAPALERDAPTGNLSGNLSGKLSGNLSGKLPSAQSRTVPLRQLSAETLATYLQQRHDQGESLTPATPLLISHHPGRRGDRLTYHGLYLAIAKIGEYAGMPDLYPYQFRHTYASDLILQGIQPRQARRLTGHQSEQSFRRYTQQIQTQQADAIAAFYQVYGEAPP
jgi:integrase/recombinase XerD